MELRLLALRAIDASRSILSLTLTSVSQRTPTFFASSPQFAENGRSCVIFPPCVRRKTKIWVEGTLPAQDALFELKYEPRSSSNRHPPEQPPRFSKSWRLPQQQMKWELDCVGTA